MSSKREKELARMRAERQAARQAAEAARRKQRNTVVAVGVVLVLIIAAVFVVVASVGGDDKSTSNEAIEPGQQAECTWNRSAQAASRPVQPPPTEPVSTPSSATMLTDRGTIAFTLNAQAPCAAASLASLASQGFYDNTPCHRLTTSGLFVLQCGDPTGTGTGGPGYQFAEEDLKGATYTRGTVAMAKGSSPGTTGSQFFIVYKDSVTPLPAEYTPIGTVTRGLSVVDTIAKAGAKPADKNGNTAPRLAVKIVTLRTNNPAGASASTSPSVSPSARATTRTTARTSSSSS